MARETLLEIVRGILSDLDSEDVNSLSDSVEAVQIANVVKDTYYSIVTPTQTPEHRELLKLTAASDSEYPTHFQYPEDVISIETIWYEDEEGRYREVCHLDPLDFLARTDRYNEDYATVYDKNGGTKIRVKTNRNPKYFTSFDDNWVVMDGYDSTVDTTLRSSKVRAFGYVMPSFSILDTFVPDLDANAFPLLKAEATSTCQSLFKGAPDGKTEQRARRLRTLGQNDYAKTKTQQPLSRYGR